jgi:hypothetical protein
MVATIPKTILPRIYKIESTMAPMTTPMAHKGGNAHAVPTAMPMTKGGAANAAAYAGAVYGSAAQQHANLAQGNAIAMNKVMNGGKSRKHKRNKRGGSMFVDLAVPATLFFAQQNSRKPGMSKSRSSRRSRRNRQTRRK